MDNKLPSLADMLKSQSNDSNKSKETEKQSLGDLLQTSLTLNKNDQSSSMGNSKSTAPPSLADLLATSTKSSTTRNTNELSPLKKTNTNIPSLTDLLKNDSLQGGCSENKGVSLTSLLSPNTSIVNNASSIPSLSDILKNSPNRSVAKPVNKVPDLSTLLNQVNINNASKKDSNTSLSPSIRNVRLSDLAYQFAEKESSCSESTAKDVTKPSKAKLKYMNQPSNFGKIFGAKFKKRDNKLYTRLKEVKNMNVNIIFTEEMFGNMGFLDVYEFNEPSPDDRVKTIQNKAFERK